MWDVCIKIKKSLKNNNNNNKHQIIKSSNRHHHGINPKYKQSKRLYHEATSLFRRIRLFSIYPISCSCKYGSPWLVCAKFYAPRRTVFQFGWRGIAAFRDKFFQFSESCCKSHAWHKTASISFIFRETVMLHAEKFNSRAKSTPLFLVTGKNNIIIL